MGRPFSERVTTDDWRRDVESWIAERVVGLGRVVTGSVEQPRVRPWSTQLVVPTDAGRLWFKANCAATRFEPAVQAELARLAPHAVDAPCALDAGRGWMLTRDRRRTLGETGELTTRDWARIVVDAARIQQAVTPHRDTLLGAGLPDHSPHTVPERLDRIVEVFSTHPEDHPAHVDAELRERLRARRPALERAADLLSDGPLPVTWQHGDLHPGNVFALPDGSLRMFDFGDGQWAHAAEVLCVPYGLISAAALPWPTVLEAYAGEWDVAPAVLQSLVDAAALTQAVNRAAGWSSFLDEATAREWAQWGDRPVHHLSRVLEP